MDFPIYVFDDCGKRKYLYTIESGTANLDGVEEMIRESLKIEPLPYSKYFTIYQGIEILVYQKSE